MLAMLIYAPITQLLFTIRRFQQTYCYERRRERYKQYCIYIFLIKEVVYDPAFLLFINTNIDEEDSKNVVIATRATLYFPF
jgi:hypothetical protein